MSRISSKFSIGDYVQATIDKSDGHHQIIGRIIEVWQRKSRYPDINEKIYYKIDNHDKYIPEENIQNYEQD